MRYRDPLKTILSQTRSYWNHDGIRPSVRFAFTSALKCRTAALGAEVFASKNHEFTLFHSCKSRACSSCGYRSSVQWLRERWAALPDVLYKGITFTMPQELWPFFRENPRMARALPALAAAVIQARIAAKHSSRVGVIAILHTFNGKLEFNPHVHSMVTGGGLCTTSNTWAARVYIERDALMEAWRRAVIRLLRVAMQARQLRSEVPVSQTNALLVQQEKRWWSVKIQSFESKAHFLQYAGRYVRRPPIAQRRITCIAQRTVTFWVKDKRLRRRVNVTCSPEEFVDRWIAHIPERHQHAVRSFGLFAPRALSQTSAAVFAMLGQERRPRPRPRPWADSIKKDFRRDPLLDPSGEKMKWTGRLAPKT